MAKSGDNSQKKGGDEMLVGEFQHNIDAKGRMIMPAKFRDELGESLLSQKGLTNVCLFFLRKNGKSWIRSFLNSHFLKVEKSNVSSMAV